MAKRQAEAFRRRLPAWRSTGIWADWLSRLKNLGADRPRTLIMTLSRNIQPMRGSVASNLYLRAGRRIAS